MADWVRNTVMLVALAMWTIYMAVALMRDNEVNPVVWTFPGAVYFALNPTLMKGKKDGSN